MPAQQFTTSRSGIRGLISGPFETGSFKRRPQGWVNAVSGNQASYSGSVPCYEGQAINNYQSRHQQ